MPELKSVPGPGCVAVPVALVLALAVGLTACSPEPRNAVPPGDVEAATQGRWQAANSPETLEFLTNGVIQGRDKYGRAIEGTYSFMDPGHVHLSLTVTSVDKDGNRGIDRSTGVCRVEVDGGSLALTDDAGQKSLYKKAR